MKIYLHISFFGIKTCCNNTVQIPAKFLGCTLLGTISIHNVLPSEQKELVKMEKKSTMWKWRRKNCCFTWIFKISNVLWITYFLPLWPFVMLLYIGNYTKRKHWFRSCLWAIFCSIKEKKLKKLLTSQRCRIHLNLDTSLGYFGKNKYIP